MNLIMELVTSTEYCYNCFGFGRCRRHRCCCWFFEKYAININHIWTVSLPAFFAPARNYLFEFYFIFSSILISPRHANIPIDFRRHENYVLYWLDGWLLRFFLSFVPDSLYILMRSMTNCRIYCMHQTRGCTRVS